METREEVRREVRVEALSADSTLTAYHTSADATSAWRAREAALACASLFLACECVT